MQEGVFVQSIGFLFGEEKKQTLTLSVVGKQQESALEQPRLPLLVFDSYCSLALCLCSDCALRPAAGLQDFPSIARERVIFSAYMLMKLELSLVLLMRFSYIN